MGSKSQAPPAPDYVDLASEQGQISGQLTQQQSAENHPDTTTPYGETGWTYNPQTQQWSGDSTLNPTLQNTLDTQENTGLAGANVQAGQVGESQNILNSELGSGNFNPLSYSGTQQVQGGNYNNQQAQDATWNEFQTMQQPLQAQQTQAEQAQLYGQGLRPGDAAYDTATNNLSNTQYQQTQNAEDQSVLAGDQEAQTMQGMDVQAQQAQIAAMNGQQNQNLNLYNSLMTSPGQQYGSSTISGPTTGVAQTPDIVGAEGQTYGAQLNQTNAANAASSGTAQGAGSLAVALASLFA